MNGIFILAEVHGEIGARLHALQERFDPKLAKEAPPHVTVIGSSGVGPIAPDTPRALIKEKVEAACASFAPIPLRFGPPMRFLQREIVVLPLDPHGPIRALHDALIKTGLPFAQARYPFTPHCTLSFYPTITRESLPPMLAVRETGTWTLDRLRVYHTRDPQPPTLLFDVTLRA